MPSRPCIIRKSSNYSEFYEQYQVISELTKQIVKNDISDEYINSKNYRPNGTLALIPDNIQTLFKEPYFMKYLKVDAGYYKTVKFFLKFNFIGHKKLRI